MSFQGPVRETLVSNPSLVPHIILEKNFITSAESHLRQRYHQARAKSQVGKKLQQTNYFPHLPSYREPTAGLVSKLPSSWQPYAQLMRIDRPAGFYAFYFPYVIGVMYAACITDTPPDPVTVLQLLSTLVPYCVLLRGIACTWNDNVDQEFDRRVVRTRHRPIARGAVSTLAAHVFTLAQLVVGYPMISYFFPARSVAHILPIVALFLIYALMKRVTYYPQVVLGFPFAWSIFFCVSILDADLFGRHLASTFALVGANILWTIIYDTVYAHQDIADDEKAGVKGMALRFRDSTKLLASILTAVQLLLLVRCGQWAGFSNYYYVGTVGGVAGTMVSYIYLVDLKSPESCGTWSHRQFWYVGAGFMAGLTAEYCHILASTFS